MPGIADLIQLLHKPVKIILLQTNTHIEYMIRRSIGGMDVPAAGNLFPRMLDLKVVPTLVERRREDGRRQKDPDSETKR